MEKYKCFGISPYASNAMLSDNPHSGIYEAKTSRTLDLNGGNPACNQGGGGCPGSHRRQRNKTFPSGGDLMTAESCTR